MPLFRPPSPSTVMLADLKYRRITAVTAWHTDRLHRWTAELETFIDAIEATGAEVATVKGGQLDLSTPDGRMVAKFHGAFAQREVERGRDRPKRAKQQAVEPGRWRGGRRPSGYESDGLTVRETETEALRSAASALIAGQSLPCVAREMADNGITTTSKTLLMDEFPMLGKNSPKKLVLAVHWTVTKTGWLITDYETYQTSRAQFDALDRQTKVGSRGI